MKKRLIVLMLSATIVASALTGCGEGKTEEEINNENEIRELLEYDANTNLSSNDVELNGIKVEYKIENEKFYITFKTQKWVYLGRTSILEDYSKITYEVDKDRYYNFKNNYNLRETKQDVELVKDITDNFDPISVINPEGDKAVGK
ncbi:MAG: hypothetical protein IJW36_02225 [Clostridia bacterium]|nr:hypothetical protein [Clostridia bacterium]